MRQVSGLSEDGNTITLRRFNGVIPQREVSIEQADRKLAIILDVETTGIDRANHKIIDLGYVVFSYDSLSGRILNVEKEFSQLQDPEEALAEVIKRLTGYSDEDLRGQKIDWQEVHDDFAKAEFIIAHNAYFDRGFLDRYLPASQGKVWACSMAGIDWKAKGHGSVSLEYLAKDHGFFYSGHTALMDAKACFLLLRMNNPDTKTANLAELMANASQPMKWVYAWRSAFETKEELKGRGYIWDEQKRCWKKKVLAGCMEEEEFIAKHGAIAEARVEGIAEWDHYK